MKFKVGDKVKIVISDPHCEKYINNIGVIRIVDRIKKGFSTHWDYEVRFSDGFCYVFTPIEIKKLITKNQQLLFDFMER